MADGLGPAAIGREINQEFIDSWSNNITPNGENDEYHTFCYDDPIFPSRSSWASLSPEVTTSF